MMQKGARVVVLAVVGVLALAGGCTNPTSIMHRGDGGGILSIDEQQYGWVQMLVSYEGGKIHWGDSYSDSAYTQVTGARAYSHFYGRPGVYDARLLDGDIELADLVIQVPLVRGRVELVGTGGLTINVRHYAEDEIYDWTVGFAPRTYWIEWGDGESSAINSHEYYALGRERPHTYKQAGTYDVSVRSPGQGTVYCFSVTLSE
jgi:hypothetical protein